MKNRVYRYVMWFTAFLALTATGCKKDGAMEKGPGAEASEILSPPLFTLLSPDSTHVSFQNKLEENLNVNVLMYEYTYNGGGVATGDFNGDGLLDIYFTSNMGDNALYLNLGNFKFNEVTKTSKVTGRPGPWKTGVTAVDVNGDHKLDLYLCYSGALPSEKRKNQLFINMGNDTNGVPIFEEKAAEYGLDSEGYSNQGYFFDYDRDGDLDMLLLNHNPQSLPVLNEVSTREALKKDDPLRGLRLFQQENGRFKDVTVKAGISGSELSYGLGIGIGDLDNDGWTDFYVSNDYTIPDYLYRNNGNGTFTDQLKESMGHVSHFSMGNDVADLNNDGWADLVTLDMLPEDNRRQKLLLSPDNYAKFDLNVRSGFHYQYMRNMLQLNNGNGTFSEIGQLAGISNTDWSWAALLADYDNDGWKDLYVTNGYHRDYTNLDFINYMESYVKNKGRLKREDVLDLIQRMPSSNLTNYLFSNRDGITFSNETKAFGLDHHANSNGAAYADLDNDGDLDLVVNNINAPAFIYRNEAQGRGNNYLQVQLKGDGANTQGIGSKVMLYAQKAQQRLEQVPTRGYLSTVTPILHFGLGEETQADSLVVYWNSGKKEVVQNVNAGQLVVVDEKNASTVREKRAEPVPLFRDIASPIAYQNESSPINDFKRQALLLGQFSHFGPCLIKGDLNSDGLEDIFIGGAKDQSAVIFIQQKNNRFIKVPVAAFETDKAYSDADAAIFDANGDGNPDIYVASGGYHELAPGDPLFQDRLYLGDGKGGFTKSDGALPKVFGSSGCVVAHDIDNDGHMDLFVGGKVVPGKYPEASPSQILINKGNGTFEDRTTAVCPELQDLGIVTDALWADLNGDGQKDLLVVGEWMPISVFINKNGVLSNETGSYFDREYSGWWNTVEVGDFNQDGILDLIGGNMGTNTQFKITPSEPAEMYYSDFDQNGSIDPFFTYYIQGKKYPYVTRDELLGQLGHLRPKFNSYEKYADAVLEDILTEEQLKGAKILTATHMQTTLFLGTPIGKFKEATLPVQAQYAPVNEVILSDFNGDGHIDMALFGNNHHFKLRLGRSDANYGVLLMGDGTGAFQYVDQRASGLDVRGMVESAVLLDDLLLLGINGGSVKAYKAMR